MKENQREEKEEVSDYWVEMLDYSISWSKQRFYEIWKGLLKKISPKYMEHWQEENTDTSWSLE